MAGVLKTPSRSAKAVYLRGDPEEPGPILRGRLSLERDGLHFTDPGGANMLIALEELKAVTVTGRRPEGVPGRTPHGTLRLASQQNGSVAVWEFAVDRPVAAQLRDRIDRLLARMRRPRLPYVEQLLGEPASETGSFAAIAPRASGTPDSDRSRVIRRRRWLVAGGAIGVFVAVDVVLPIVLTH
jgi:hypothetical protein